MTNVEIELKKIASDAIDAAAEDLYWLSDQIWKNPEIAMQEHFAHNCVSDFLEKRSFDSVERRYCLETALRASYGTNKSGPHVAVLSEYDALPGIGHACGHNLICEVGVAAALGIKAVLERSKEPLGRLTLLGTPAEEAGCGKGELIEAGAFQDVDIAMMAHPSPYSLLKPNYMALIELNICYKGRASHAAEWPWRGINALDAAVLCYQNISCLRQQLPPSWMVHGVITNGGQRPNIIPEETSLEFYLRAPTDPELDQLKDKIVSCLTAAATATNCKVKYKFDSNTGSLMSNDTMVTLYEKNALSLGLDIERNDWIVKKPGGSSDMGNVSHVVPSIHPEFYIGTSHSAHTIEFTSAAGDKKAQPYTLKVAKSLAMTAVDIFLNPELISTIRNDFEAGLKAEQEKCQRNSPE